MRPPQTDDPVSLEWRNHGKRGGCPDCKRVVHVLTTRPVTCPHCRKRLTAGMLRPVGNEAVK